MKRIAIVGAGAAGLMAAKLLSSQKDMTVMLFEKAKNVGTKLRASGGGKANIYNRNIKGLHYNNEAFMNQFLQNFNVKDIEHTFAEMGLMTSVDDEGRVYPATFFSATVIDVLLNNLPSRIQFHCDCCVEKLTNKKGQWWINEIFGPFDKVILSSGSPANMIAKNRCGLDSYLNDFNLDRKEFRPSLVGFKIEDYPKTLSGCKAKAEVTLYQKNKPIWKERGEVQFKEDGISGIVIMNISAYYNRLKTQSQCSLSLDFLPDGQDFDIESYLSKYHNLAGLLHPKLNQLFIKKPFDIHHYEMKIKETYEIEFAQVCSGGISLEEINENFELKKYPGLYAIGEMLDIDGICGGYNLFFAFASAQTATNQLTKTY